MYFFAGACDKDYSKINKIETDVMRIVTGATSSTALLKIECGWEIISQRRIKHVLILYKITEGDAPTNLTRIFQELTYINDAYNLRNKNL